MILTFLKRLLPATRSRFRNRPGDQGPPPGGAGRSKASSQGPSKRSGFRGRVRFRQSVVLGKVNVGSDPGGPERSRRRGRTQKSRSPCSQGRFGRRPVLGKSGPGGTAARDIRGTCGGGGPPKREKHRHHPTAKRRSRDRPNRTDRPDGEPGDFEKSFDQQKFKTQ